MASFWRLVLSSAAFGSFTTAIRSSGSSYGIPLINETYDYIVVGGGNAGLTLATRLAQQQSGSVAVIEAGGFYEVGNGNYSQVPLYDYHYITKDPNDWHPLIDWGYVTSPQSSAYDVKMHYARGKTLGGCSARNYMIYQRGTVGSYKLWSDMVGDDSYQFDKLMPYFQKSICFTPPNEGGQYRYVNSTPKYDVSVMGNCSGPLSVTYSNYAYQFGSWATQGLQQMGFAIIDGFQSGKLLGQSYVMSTINAKTQQRDSSETSFMRKALDLPNFTVYTMTQAKKITFDQNKKATGVDVDTLGAKYHLSARKEVVVSAGVFGSPHLLMVSGIGPKAALESAGVPVVADRPGVGQNMQDHVYYGPAYKVIGQTVSSMQFPDFASAATDQYIDHQTGVLTNPANDVLGWEKIPQHLRSQLSDNARKALAEYPEDWPEVEYLAINAYLGMQDKPGGNDPADGSNYATMGAALIAPHSRGNLTITSPDNAVHPIINPNFFGDPVDAEVAVSSYKRIREFWLQSNVTAFRADDKEAFPGLNVSSDAEIEAIIKKSFLMIFHAACTCSMGKANDTRAVVDSQARVYGVKGLRVVDASVFPILIPGHPMSTVYALAEKIADVITSRKAGAYQEH